MAHSADNHPAMKCLGLIGNLNDALLGLYPKTINTEAHKDLGGHHSANMRVSCEDTSRLNELLDDENWEASRPC